MRPYMNGSAVSPSDCDSSPSKSSSSAKNGLVNTALKRVSSATSNQGRRSQSSLLSVGGDTNSLLGGGCSGGKKTPKRISGSVTTTGGGDGSQLSLKLQTNLIQSVKKSLAKTKRQWDRTGLIHIIYVLVLLTYSFVGGAVFMALDGPHADRVLNAHQTRCVVDRDRAWTRLVDECTNRTFDECRNRTFDSFMLLDECLRNAPQVPFNHSTSNYWNSLIYAITVFTTIGYGNIVVTSFEGRLAMLVYAMVGIPLFFAFLNDMGQWFHFKFLKIYDWLRRRWSQSRMCTLIVEIRRRRKLMPNDEHDGGGGDPTKTMMASKGGTKGKSKKSDDEKDGHDSLIFTFAVIVLVFYLVIVCGGLMLMVRHWTFYQAFYFLFQSISLIGFGDEFPDNPIIVLFNITFIIVGIILLSMCFFILQEWIRGKTYRLSTQVRRSVRKWRHYRPVVTHSLLDRHRRVKSARIAVPLLPPHLTVQTGGDGSTATTRWRRRSGRRTTDVANVAGHRLAVVDDCSPGPGRRAAVVAVLTFEEDESSREERPPMMPAPIMRRASPAPRRDGVHSVDDALMVLDDGQQKVSTKRAISVTDGVLVDMDDGVFLKPGPYTPATVGGRRANVDRRHTVCLDEISAAVVLEERKRTPSWIEASNQTNQAAAPQPRKPQKNDQVQKRISFHDRPAARFGKFQWIRQTHDEEDEDDEDEDEGDSEEVVEVVEEVDDDEIFDEETDIVAFSLPADDEEEETGDSQTSEKDEYL